MNAFYDPWLVGLSVVIAIIAAYTTLALTERLMANHERSYLYWIAGGALSMGVGIWSMHFIGMLAFHLPIPLAYDLELTIASIIPAIFASGIALFTVRSGRRSLYTVLLAGLFMGAGIAAMHYTGMAAMRMFPAIRYDPLLFTLSIAIAIGASIAALEIAFRLKEEEHSRYLVSKKLGSALVMGIAIAGMHYTGMAAAEFAEDSVCLAAPQGIEPGWLAIMVGIGSLAVLSITLMISVFDARMADQNAALVTELTHTNEQLHQRAQMLADKMTEELRARMEKEHLFKAVVEQSSDAIITRDLDGNLSSWNPAAEQMFGYAEKEVLGSHLFDIIHPGGIDEKLAQKHTEAETGGCFQEIIGESKLGEKLQLAVSCAPLSNAQGIRVGDVSILRDITQSKHAEEQLKQAAAVFENTTEGVMITDNQANIIAVNQAFTQLTGYPEEYAVGQKAGFTRSGIHDKSFYAAMWESIKANDFWRGEIIDRRKSGETYPKWLNISVVRNNEGEIIYYVGVFSDITHLKETEARLQHIAQHDFLTNLPNRLLFEDRLEHAIARAHRDGSKISLLFLDLDRFKNINDSLGHLVGDQLLQEVARRITLVVREEDTIARLGGDEFTVILESISNRDQASLAADKIIDAITERIEIDEHELYVTTSIGIATYPDDGEEITLLLKNADAAMYKAKESGRNQFHFYSSDISSELVNRLTLEGELRKALERREFRLHYQPLIDAGSKRIIGAEALIRWQHPLRGLLTPFTFLSVAEESGFMVSIEEWVIEEACRQAQVWQQAGHRDLAIAVNLSSKLISYHDIADRIANQLERHQLDSSALQLEITETSIVEQTETLITNLELIDRIGIPIAIDDFGTGYSSMSYLKRFAVCKLKIDRSFVRDIAEDPNDKAIVKAVIAMGHSLGMRVTAEGVETQEQLAFLESEGCDELQGYLYSQPLDSAAFEILLADWPHNG